MASIDRLQTISKTLTDARKAAKALPGYPGELLETFAEAYEVQRLSRGVWDDPVAGWKVGGVPADFIEHFGEERLTGPIFQRSVVTLQSDETAMMPVFEGGFSAIEPEFIIELGETRAQDRMYIGAEVAGSPIPAINDVGPIAVISDFGNNRGMIIGPEIHDWQNIDHAPVTVETHINGELIASRTVDDLRVDPRKALKFWLSHAEKNALDTAAGTYISSGAITGVHEAPIGAQSVLDFGRFGSVSLELTKAEPHS